MLNPILASSALRRMRSRRTLVIVGAYVLVMLALALGGMLSYVSQSRVNLDQLPQGQRAYMMLILAQLALIALVAPVMTASSIAGERERQTLELLLVTNTSSIGIVFGKMMESFAFLALMILCALPVSGLVLVVGGATLSQILLGTLFLLCCAFVAACVGVFSSSFMKNTVGATIVSYLLMLAVGGATLIPLVIAITPQMRKTLMDAAQYAAMAPADAMRMLPKPLYINPAVGLAALLEMQTGRIVAPYVTGGGRLPALFLMLKKIGYVNVVWINMALMGALSLALVCLGALFVRPGRVRVRRKGRA